MSPLAGVLLGLSVALGGVLLLWRALARRRASGSPGASATVARERRRRVAWERQAASAIDALPEQQLQEVQKLTRRYLDEDQELRRRWEASIEELLPDGVNTRFFDPGPLRPPAGGVRLRGRSALFSERPRFFPGSSVD